MNDASSPSAAACAPTADPVDPMTQPVRQQLPNLEHYRAELAAAGTRLPLPQVPFAPDGLLATLPAPGRGRTGWPWDRQTAPFVATAEAGNWPVITVVMPSFNQAAYLEEGIRSVLLQNYPWLEFIVVDGGSSDGSAAIIDRYRPWLSFARIGPDRGQAHAVNLGFSIAAGDGLRAWLNSDDFYTPGALRRVAEAYRRTRADFLYGDSIDFNQAKARCRPVATRSVSERYVRFGGMLWSHACFWSAAIHAPLWEELTCALDYELWVRLLPGRRTFHVRWPLGVFRQHGEAKSYSPAMRRRWEHDAALNHTAHPDLYRPDRWLELEFKLLNRLLHGWRSRRVRKAFLAVCTECGRDWPNA